MSPLGINIARYRKAEGLSAAELAELAGEGLSRSVIANLESGRKDDVSVKQLIALSNALRVMPPLLVADLFNPGGESPFTLPRLQIPGFNPSTVTRESALSGTSNWDLYRYFSGRSLPHERSEGAARLVFEIVTAFSGHEAALARFRTSALDLDHRISGGERRDDDDHKLGLELAVTGAAAEVLRWNSVLGNLGVDTGRSESDLITSLSVLGLPTTLEGLAQYGGPPEDWNSFG